MIIGGKGECRHARVCESVRGLVKKKHRKRVRRKQWHCILCSQSKVTGAVEPFNYSASLRRQV